MSRKIFFVIEREVRIRIRKRSFWLSTLLTPLFIVLIMLLPAAFMLWFSDKNDTLQVLILDEDKLLEQDIASTQQVAFRFVEGDYLSYSQDFRQEQKGKADILLHIPQQEPNKPTIVLTLLSRKAISLKEEEAILSQVKQRLETLRLLQSGIDRSLLEKAKVELAVNNLLLAEDGQTKQANTGVLFGIGLMLSFVIYFSVFIYGVQVMRGVMEEKGNRIAEVIIAMLSPMDMMLGKILGIGLVGLLQFFFWIILTLVFLQLGQFFLPTEWADALRSGSSTMTSIETTPAMEVLGTLADLDLGSLIAGFLFYYLSGYFLYSALFAAIGAAVDSETDAQQFTLPITMPLILAFVLGQAVLNQPDGSLALWLSMIPFTSPIIMVIRLPYGVPAGQLLLSMGIMLSTFLAITWLAGRIYRTGILLYGSKPSYRDLLKWMFNNR